MVQGSAQQTRLGMEKDKNTEAKQSRPIREQAAAKLADSWIC